MIITGYYSFPGVKGFKLFFVDGRRLAKVNFHDGKRIVVSSKHRYRRVSKKTVELLTDESSNRLLEFGGVDDNLKPFTVRVFKDSTSECIGNVEIHNLSIFPRYVLTSVLTPAGLLVGMFKAGQQPTLTSPHQQN